jgi:hypothetical protein
MPWYKTKLDIVADIFRQANLGKTCDEKPIFIRLKAILDAFLTK